MPKYTAPLNIEYDDGKSVEQVRKELEAAINDLQLSGIERDKKIAQLEQNMISMQSAIGAKQTYGTGGGQSGGNGTTLLDKSNLTYQGSFMPEIGTFSTVTADFSGGGISYNADNDSLFCVGKISSSQWGVMEFDIPATLSDGTVVARESITQGSNLQAKAFTSGDLSRYNLDSDASVVGTFYAGGTLYSLVSEYYDANTNSDGSHLVWSSSTLSGATPNGLFTIGTLLSGYTSVYMGAIPAAQQSRFGSYTHFSGKAGGPIVTASGNGPGFILFNAANITGTPGQITAANAMYYPNSNRLGGEQDEIWNSCSHVVGGAILTGTNCAVFFGDGATPGSKGSVQTGYGLPSVYNDSNRAGSGFHSQDGDYGFFLWWYDLDDLESAYSGSISSWAVQPYHWENITVPHQLGGAESYGFAYDPTGKRLFLCEGKSAGTNEFHAYPMIHVYTHP